MDSLKNDHIFVSLSPPLFSQWQWLPRPRSTHLPPPLLFISEKKKIITTCKLQTSLRLTENAPDPRKMFLIPNDRDKRPMEDCGYGPGLGLITVSLTTVIPARTPAPPSTPMPLRTSTPTVLNCSALTSTCHLHFPPHCAESPHTSHTTTPTHPLAGPTGRHKGRQINENHTHPHAALSVSNA